jgi:hypothetical protein
MMYLQGKLKSIVVVAGGGGGWNGCVSSCRDSDKTKCKYVANFLTSLFPFYNLYKLRNSHSNKCFEFGMIWKEASCIG